MGVDQRFDDWERVHENRWYTLFRQGNWHVLGVTGGRSGAAVLIIDSEDQVLLLENYRIAVDAVCLEIPRGMADAEEGRLACARREAREETGLDLAGDGMVSLGSFWPDSGILSTRVGLFAARLDQPFSSIEIDQDESKAYRIVSVADLHEMVASGEISDGMTIAACARYFGLGNSRRRGQARIIEIFDGLGAPQAEIETSDPDWSFEQYCRNRVTAGWTWRFKRSTAT